jgi:hypothetical protein
MKYFSARFGTVLVVYMIFQTHLFKPLPEQFDETFIPAVVQPPSHTGG